MLALTSSQVSYLCFGWGLGHFCMHSPLLSGILFGAVVHILFGCDFPLSRQTRAPREWAPALFRSLLTPFTLRFSVPFAIRGTTEADPAFVVRDHIQSTHLSGFLFPCRHLAPFLLFSGLCSPRLARLYSHLSFPFGDFDFLVPYLLLLIIRPSLLPLLFLLWLSFL